jgi:hypothetical protein
VFLMDLFWIRVLHTEIFDDKFLFLFLYLS